MANNDLYQTKLRAKLRGVCSDTQRNLPKMETQSHREGKEGNNEERETEEEGRGERW